MFDYFLDFFEHEHKDVHAKAFRGEIVKYLKVLEGSYVGARQGEDFYCKVLFLFKDEFAETQDDVFRPRRPADNFMIKVAGAEDFKKFISQSIRQLSMAVDTQKIPDYTKEFNFKMADRFIITNHTHRKLFFDYNGGEPTPVDFFVLQLIKNCFTPVANNVDAKDTPHKLIMASPVVQAPFKDITDAKRQAVIKEKCGLQPTFIGMAPQTATSCSIRLRFTTSNPAYDEKVLTEYFASSKLTYSIEKPEKLFNNKDNLHDIRVTINNLANEQALIDGLPSTLPTVANNAAASPVVSNVAGSLNSAPPPRSQQNCILC